MKNDAALIPTLESFSVAFVEKHQCLRSKPLITCKVILPTQNDQLDAVIWTNLFMKNKNYSKIWNKVVYNENKWNHFGRHG
jgi:hypothetical protein